MRIPRQSLVTFFKSVVANLPKHCSVHSGYGEFQELQKLAQKNIETCSKKNIILPVLPGIFVIFAGDGRKNVPEVGTTSESSPFGRGKWSFVSHRQTTRTGNDLHSWLVVKSTPLKNMSSSIGMIIPNIWKNKYVPNHQPVRLIFQGYLRGYIADTPKIWPSMVQYSQDFISWKDHRHVGG